ncbi:transmembrane GTPase Marf isoform X1 [Aphis craccivora]|uniref:Transmembrane GTPase Marf isoform X1 n=1 Tax=Aphis craccivora TaxID=307492 RepID=A0A6G0X4X2_APHCR|nr:transmembrane GTPase Marf isoform X1 [Aphis craccivora]
METMCHPPISKVTKTNTRKRDRVYDVLFIAIAKIHRRTLDMNLGGAGIINGTQLLKIRLKINELKYGTTSNGKSTVVNVMLGEIKYLLPSVIQLIVFCKLKDLKLVKHINNEKQNVESVTHLAHALYYEQELVHVYCVLAKRQM